MLENTATNDTSQTTININKIETQSNEIIMKGTYNSTRQYKCINGSYNV